MILIYSDWRPPWLSWLGQYWSSMTLESLTNVVTNNNTLFRKLLFKSQMFLIIWISVFQILNVCVHAVQGHPDQSHQYPMEVSEQQSLKASVLLILTLSGRHTWKRSVLPTRSWTGSHTQPPHPTCMWNQRTMPHYQKKVQISFNFVECSY